MIHMINWVYEFSQVCVFRADNAKEWSFIPEEEKVKLTNPNQIKWRKIQIKTKMPNKSKPNKMADKSKPNKMAENPNQNKNGGQIQTK